MSSRQNSGKVAANDFHVSHVASVGVEFIYWTIISEGEEAVLGLEEGKVVLSDNRVVAEFKERYMEWNTS